jgi:hypothetical protein
MQSTVEKIPVSEKALMARVNRKLAREGERILKSREGSRLRGNVGEFYLLDVNRNTVTGTHMELEHVAKEVGALRDYEQVVYE